MYRWLRLKAGTGKSTLVNFIIAALNLNPNEEVCYIAYTGKAATVLKQKGCPNATTAHKLLYYSKQLPTGKFIHKPVTRLKDSYKIIVVDEISMLPLSMWQLLLAHKIHILALGDPGQLPPVEKDEDNHVLDNPHIFLDEVMRQAQDSEIIRLSMHIRNNYPLHTFKCDNKEVQIISPYDAHIGIYKWADQVLCATNATRNAINTLMRQAYGFGPEPNENDKIISLSNHWDFMSDFDGWALTNGCIGNIDDKNFQTMYLPKYIYSYPLNIMMTNMSIESDTFTGIPIDYKCLQTGEPTLSAKAKYLLSKNKTLDFEPPFEFAYAYAISCHKAQGSEWKNVFVIEERFPFFNEEHKRWLYTACTRASEKLIIARKE